MGKREWDRSPMYQYMSDDQKGRHGRVVIDIVQKGTVLVLESKGIM